MNQIFGYQKLPEDISSNNIAFDGAQPVSMPMYFDAKPGQLQILAPPETHIQTCVSQMHEAYSYLWGIPAHPDIDTSDIAEWCANVVAEKRYSRFKELIGPFVVIVDEPGQHRFTIVTDILGVRPMFFGKHNGRIVLGSRVWPIQKAGLSEGIIDYDAVASWIAYGYNCTDGSLFSDLHRLPPGTAVVFQDNQFIEIPYVQFEPKAQSPSGAQAAEELHHIVSSTMKTLLAEHPQISIALSGGYDSRYLLALSLSLQGVSIDCATVSFTQAEGHIASQVARTLKIPLKHFPVDRSIWDLYDPVYHFMADGFPISKFVTYHIAQQHPQIPMVNGFMGDSLMRGSKDTFLGKYETEWNGDLADILQRKHLFNSFNIFRKDIAERIKIRSGLPMEQAVRKASKFGKAFAWTDFYCRQRHYISNNFLQHIQISEALLPFYSWPLLRHKMDHDYRVFGRHIYHRIFRDHFPKLADIPHASDCSSRKNQRFLGSRWTIRKAPLILRIIRNKEWLTLLRRERAISRSMLAIAGLRHGEHEVMTYWRLYLLEKRLRGAGLTFDWESI